MFWCDSLYSRTDVAEPKLMSVDGLSFASIIRRSGIKFNAFIIDIEGGEQHIQVSEIPDYVNKVVIEIHPDVIGGLGRHIKF